MKCEDCNAQLCENWTRCGICGFKKTTKQTMNLEEHLGTQALELATKISKSPSVKDKILELGLEVTEEVLQGAFAGAYVASYIALVHEVELADVKEK